MTVLHEEELDESQVCLQKRTTKKIPHWAQKNQLQIAIINQVYLNKNPSQIFGKIQLDNVREMINGIELWNEDRSFFQSLNLNHLYSI